MTELAICIPTYNRAEYLPTTLDSLISQADNDVEIVISDNASTDNTKEIIEDYQKRFPRLTYFCWPENKGADINYLKSVDLANSKYCWLMGSDDAAKPGSIKRIKQEIKEGHGIYLFNRTACDINLVPRKEDCFFDTALETQVFSLSDRDQMITYLRNSRSLGAVFSFLSSLVFRREEWNNITCNEAFLTSAYSHVYMLMSMIQNGNSLKYIKDTLVYWRGDNDGFLLEGKLKRLMLDINGYSMVAFTFFENNDILLQEFLKMFRRIRNFRNTVFRLREWVDRRTWKQIRKRLKKMGYNKLALFILSHVGSIGTKVISRTGKNIRKTIKDINKIARKSK